MRKTDKQEVEKLEKQYEETGLTEDEAEQRAFASIYKPTHDKHEEMLKHHPAESCPDEETKAFVHQGRNPDSDPDTDKGSKKQNRDAA